jgi:hypothetical protein
MPYRSKAQVKWAFATGQEFAEKWADHTPNIKNLPERVKSKAKRLIKHLKKRKKK